jgi:hypothetical protein
MDRLDKIIMQEANQVTPDDYKSITGTSLEESMARMKEHMAEVKARSAKAKKANSNVIKMNFAPADMRYAMPVAASAEKAEVADVNEGKEKKE